MNAARRAAIRLQVAQGHWALGEQAEALAALDRAAREDPTSQGLLDWIEAIRDEACEGPVARYVEALQEQLLPTFRAVESPDSAPGEAAGFPRRDELPATPTLAELLADQGHRDRALQVTDDVLRDNPANERALAVRARLQVRSPAGGGALATLERWLANLERRKPREVDG